MPIFIEQIGKLLQFDIPGEFTLVIHIALGVILLFFGLKMFRLWLGITGLGAGAYLGLLLVSKLNLESPVSWIVIALLAAAGAFVLALAYKACFFFGGFVAGIYFSAYLLDIFFTDYQRYLVLLLGLACALVALFLREQFTIIVTAATGALLAADAGVSLLYKVQPGSLLFRMQSLDLQLSEDLLVLLLTALLAVIGVLVQLRQKKNRLFS